jgi:hypothetical protein
LEFNRSEGGKRQWVFDLFFPWLRGITEAEESVKTPFGDEKIPAGVERWRYLCRKVPVDDPTIKLMEPVAGSGFLFPRRGGMDSDVLGRQLFAYCADWLYGARFLDENWLPTGQPIPLEQSVVAEPGGKARVVTPSLAAVVLYGQPLAHVLKEYLACDPTMRAGLSSGAQAWEYLKRLYAARQTANRRKVWLLSDFEEASDFISHEVARIIIDELLVKSGITSQYARGYLYFITQEAELCGIPTVRGIPMGLPCCKPILHLIGKVMSIIARDIQTPRSFEELAADTFSCAGDDVVDHVDLFTAFRYPRAAEILRMKLSVSKSGAYLVGGPFCEVMLRHGNYDPYHQTGDENSALIDGVRCRLMSSESRPGFGDEDRNPIFGKAMQLSKETTWCDNKVLIERAKLCFIRNFHLYSRGKSPMKYLPLNLGGLGPATADLDIYSICPEWLKKIVCALGTNYHDVALRTLRMWGSQYLHSRGIPKVEMAEALDIYADVLLPLEVESIYRELTEGKTPYPGYVPSYWQMTQVCREGGWLPLREACTTSWNACIWNAEVPTRRGWPLQPFSSRDACIAKLADSLTGIKPKKEYFLSKLDGKQEFKDLWFPATAELMNLDSGLWEPLNMQGDGISPRLFLSLGNKRILSYVSS